MERMVRKINARTEETIRAKARDEVGGGGEEVV